MTGVQTCALPICFPFTIITVDIIGTNASVAPDTITSRIGTSPWGMLKRSKPANTYVPWLGQPGVLVNPGLDSGTHRSILRNFSDAPSQTSNSVYFYDDNFMLTSLRLSGMQGQTLRIDMQVCVEYNVGLNSATYALTKAPPKHDPVSLEIVSSMESKVPAAMSSNEKVNIPYKNLDQVVSMVEKMVQPNQQRQIMALPQRPANGKPPPIVGQRKGRTN